MLRIVGIIMNYGHIYCDEFNIALTLVQLSMVGRHVVVGFYRQIHGPFKQGRKKLVIICVLCAKSLDGTNYYRWTWVKCERVLINNNNNLLFRLDNHHAGVASFKALVINKNKKCSLEIVPETVHSIDSSPNTRVASSITVAMKKSSVELVKRDVFFWLVGSGTPFEKTLSPAFCCIFKPISGYTGLRRQTFNTMLDEDYDAFTICVVTKLLGC